jgi:hypothetical protein
MFACSRFVIIVCIQMLCSSYIWNCVVKYIKNMFSISRPVIITYLLSFISLAVENFCNNKNVDTHRHTQHTHTHHTHPPHTHTKHTHTQQPHTHTQHTYTTHKPHTHTHTPTTHTHARTHHTHTHTNTKHIPTHPIQTHTIGIWCHESAVFLPFFLKWNWAKNDSNCFCIFHFFLHRAV